MRHFTKKKREVIISRGELVQIGGGFRVGEMLEASGARLREVGATNKTMVEDYARAIGPETALILRVHQSNFYIGGFAGVDRLTSQSRIWPAAGVYLSWSISAAARFPPPRRSV